MPISLCHRLTRRPTEEGSRASAIHQCRSWAIACVRGRARSPDLRSRGPGPRNLGPPEGSPPDHLHDFHRSEFKRSENPSPIASDLAQARAAPFPATDDPTNRNCKRILTRKLRRPHKPPKSLTFPILHNIKVLTMPPAVNVRFRDRGGLEDDGISSPLYSTGRQSHAPDSARPRGGMDPDRTPGLEGPCVGSSIFEFGPRGRRATHDWHGRPLIPGVDLPGGRGSSPGVWEGQYCSAQSLSEAVWPNEAAELPRPVSEFDQ